MILKGNQIIGNDSHCDCLFPFDNSLQNNGNRIGSWNQSFLFSTTNVFGTHAANLASQSYKIFTFTTPLRVTSGLYFSCFLRLNSATSGVPLLFYYNNSYRIYLNNNADKKYRIVAYHNGTIMTDTGLYSSAVNLNQFYFIQGYMTTNKIYLFVGNKKTEYNIASCPTFNADSIRVNTSSYTDIPFDGLMDSLQIKTRVKIPESLLYTTKNRES